MRLVRLCWGFSGVRVTRTYKEGEAHSVANYDKCMKSSSS